MQISPFALYSTHKICGSVDSATQREVLQTSGLGSANPKTGIS